MDRFWSKVQKSDGCWIWLAGRDDKNYGTFGFNGVVQKAHRVSYQLSVGPIPEGAHILHSCDNPSCVNPEHLRPGTRSDNMRDKVARGRDHNASKSECIHGHPFSEANTYRTRDGRRQCRTCLAARKRAHRRRLSQQQKEAA